jgi:NNP family nitrate/nitrite transporter-like MFS transporter
MTKSDFLKAGHWPTLLAAFLYFDVSFMVWVLLGPLAPFVSETLDLTPVEKGLLVATPLLAGSFFRPLLGALADRIGGRNTGLIGLSVTLLPLLAGWQLASELPHFFAIGVLLGVAGASFAVALPLASRWYPAEHQGLAMGIAGAGNSGTLLATLFAPRIAAAFGWSAAFALALLPVAAVLVIFYFLAKESPAPRKPIGLREYGQVLRDGDTLWFCFFYSLTFGGFVGLASFLTVFFHEQYGLTKVMAGDFTTLVVLCGSFLRPVGGGLADRFGGYRVLTAVLALAGCGLGLVGALPSVWVALALLATTMALLGIGNGAIFQMVPHRFSTYVGVITGLVGAAGGVGGFFLPSMLGSVRQMTGSYGPGLIVFAAIVLSGSCSLLLLGRTWQKSWPAAAAARAGLASRELVLEQAA